MTAHTAPPILHPFRRWTYDAAMGPLALLIFALLAADGGTVPAPATALPPGAVELLPRGAAPDAKLPLIIAIHGRGGNALRFAQFIQVLGPPARIVSLQAPDRWGEGYSWLELPLASAAGDDRELTRAIAGRAADLQPVIARIAAGRPHCGDPIIVGYSQGGAITLALAVSAPPGFKAQYFEVAGALPPSFPFSDHLPDLVGFHGTADQSVSYAEAVATFQRAPRTVTWTLFAYEGAGHDPSRELRQDLGDELQKASRRACR
ncbi:MAG TPA: hypothetical protein VND93_20805 [Myxococcales bacterium]|nr:hypothetical protein [Myxococcales bacterium]